MLNNPNARDNLKPAKKGEIRNPNGRPKGTKNLSTYIRELEDESFDWGKLPETQHETISQLGAPWKAIVYVAMQNALSGDIRAAEWLRKAGYGDKVDVTTMGESINPYSQLSVEELRKLAGK